MRPTTSWCRSCLLPCMTRPPTTRKHLSPSLTSRPQAGGDVGALAARLASRCASPAAMVNTLRRKMKIHRLHMHPQQIEQLWSLLQQSPAQVAEMFDGAPVEAILEEVRGEKKKLDILVRCSQQIKEFEGMSNDARRVKNGAVWTEWATRYEKRLAVERSRGVATSSSEASMRRTNPCFVLRNWVAQEAIEAAERGILGRCTRCLGCASSPSPLLPPMPQEAVLCAAASRGRKYYLHMQLVG